MPKPYSVDLRSRIVKAYEEGKGTQEAIAEKYQISLRTFTRYWEQYQETGNILPNLEKSGRPCRIDASGLAKIKLMVEQKPDMTLAEIGQQYNGRRSKPVGRSVIWNALIKLGFRRKKKSRYCTEQERSDIKK